MITITFPDRATEKRALAFLLGRFSGHVLKSGEHLVPEAAWRPWAIRTSLSPSKARRPMSSNWRRFEVLLPLQFNDGNAVPGEWLAEAVLELVDRFGAASYETQKVEGHWRHGGVLYRDVLVRLVVDVPDSSDHRNWIKEFKARWRVKLKQLELWVVSYRIDIE